MEHIALFIEAIEACNKCVSEDDRSSWWPRVVRSEGTDAILDVDGTEARCCCGPSDLGNSYALLRLVADESRICALFAYPAKDGIRPVDVVVGFLDKDRGMTLAWDGERVLPMIGNQAVVNVAPPPDAEWIVAAAFQKDHRRAISLFAHGVDQATLKQATEPPAAKCCVYTQANVFWDTGSKTASTPQ